MALTVVRTTYSGVLRDNMDFATSFCDADGRLVAQGLTLPGHLGSVPTALAAVLDRYGDAVREGDVFCLNDPYEGGMHLPDLFIVQPIFHESVLAAFAVVSSHHVDTGGRVPGSNAADSTEIYQEGLRIPPCRLYDRGEPNDTLFRILPYGFHLAVDLSVGLIFIAAPFVLGFSGIDAWYYWANGAAVLVVVSLHKPDPAPKHLTVAT